MAADNTVRNNIFALGAEYQIMRTRAEDHLSFTFERNIIYFDSGLLLGGNWTGDQYRMSHNLYWDARGKCVIQPPGYGRDGRRSDVREPGGLSNFQLSPNSPAWKLGWKAWIDMTTVGPR